MEFRCFASSEYLQVFAKPNGFPQGRLGLIVAKKKERLAVNRNRVKRLIREVFRARQPEIRGLDLVVRLRSRVSKNNARQMVREMENLLVQIQRCRG
jgi:ribonuclease P protein component